MGYIKKIKTDKDKKKVVSVRVPEIVVNAFNSAGVEAKEFGYEFKMPDVIEEALINTLNELRDETGVDFLKLEKFKYEMNSLQEKLGIKSKKRFDFNQLSNEIKSQAFNIGNLGKPVDIDLMIKEQEQQIKLYWSEHMINEKEKKVTTELEKLTENNKILEGQLSDFNNRMIDDYYNSGEHDCHLAHNSGWGDIYDKVQELSDKARQETFDTLMKKNEKMIQERIDMDHKRIQKDQKDSLCKKYPEKTDAEIQKIIDQPFTMDDFHPLSPMPNTD